MLYTCVLLLAGVVSGGNTAGTIGLPAKDKTRLVMPPAGAIPIMAVLYLLFSLVIPNPWIEPFCGFFIIGYLIYDYIHYATHHFPMRNPVAKYLKLYHLKHHYSGETGRYGVSSPLWDRAFGSGGNPG